MKNIILLAFSFAFLFSCSSDDPNPGEDVNPTDQSPVILDLNEVPYAKLSSYNFFKSPMKNQDPVVGVIPYDLINNLFTDYAEKNRFIWMPEGVKAEYVDDEQPLFFPDGAAVIKNFYYENTLPDNQTRILETRLMIRKNGEWKFANYVWNDAQTEAFLDLNGSDVDISWLKGGELKTTTYRIPSESECFICHKIEESPILIGPKPHNMNKVYSYSDGPMNQLEKLKRYGYLDAQSLPQNISTMPDWTYTENPLEDRMRSYLDINCAHCHQDLAHCGYTPIKLNWEMTSSHANLGLCVPTSEPLPGINYTITPGNPERSGMYFRFMSNEVSTQMPLIGKSLIHEEAGELMYEWISQLQSDECY